MEYHHRLAQTGTRIVGPGISTGSLPQPDSVIGRFKPTFDNLAKEIHWIQTQSGGCMLRWALGFFIIALVAALLGFTGISLAAAGIAKILFYLFLILFLVTLMGHLLRRS